jgi:hypothetical protein
MATQSKPLPQYEFKGLHLAGNPITRPPGSAFVADNLRIMPGEWLRLASGRRARRNLTDAKRIHRITDVHIRSSNLSDDKHLLLVEYAASVFKVVVFDLATMTVDETGIETLDGGASLAPDCRYCSAQLSNSVIFANGGGQPPPSGPSTVPSLTQWVPPGTVRYFGLRKPLVTSVSVTFTPGAGLNSIGTSVRLFMGFHNVETQHYSNGVEIGELSPSSGGGTITVDIPSGTAWSAATHGAAETAEQRYVFYATLDGLNVPYLIMNADLDGPYTATIDEPFPSVATQTVSLSITADGVNGWILDTTKEMPTLNEAPYMMRSLAHVGSRLYGIYADTDTTLANQLDRSVVVWSQADGSQRSADFLGDPLQSWPLQNVTNTPSAERPLALWPAPSTAEVMVFTATHTFPLREQADNLQEWGDAISDEHGLYPISYSHAEALICKTRHGVVWLTQNRQLAIYTTTGEFKILSADYDAITSSADRFTCLNYVYDPKNKIDRVDLFWQQLTAGGGWISRSLCHDFSTGAFTTTGFFNVYAAHSISSRLSAAKHHFLGASQFNITQQEAGSLSSGLYTYEGHPDADGKVPTRDQIFVGGSGQTKTIAEMYDGYYVPNWNSFGDPNVIKQISQIDFIGDGATASSLGAPAITLGFYTGFLPVFNRTSMIPWAALNTLLLPEKTLPIDTDAYYRFKPATPHANFWKFLLRVRPHGADYGDWYSLPEEEGDLDIYTNFYGSVMGMFYSIGPTENRL